MNVKLDEILQELRTLDLRGFYERDMTGVETLGDIEIAGIFAVADALRRFREKNYATLVFQSGLALWDRALGEAGFPAFAGACDLLGLRAVEAEIAPLTLAGACPDVVATQAAVGEMCSRLYQSGALHQRPLVVDPQTALPAILRLIHLYGGVAPLRGKEVPAPAGAAADLGGLCARFGVTLGQGEPGWEESWQIEALRPYVLAAIIFLGKCPEPVGMLERLRRQSVTRRQV